MTEIKEFRCNICRRQLARCGDGRSFEGRGITRSHGGELFKFGPVDACVTHLCDDCIKELALLLSPVTHVMQGKAVCSFEPGDTVYLANDGLAHPVKKADGFEPEEKLLHMYKDIDACTWGFECGGDVVTGSYTKNEDDVTCFVCKKAIEEKKFRLCGVTPPQCPKCKLTMKHVGTGLRFATPPVLTFLCCGCKHREKIEAR